MRDFAFGTFWLTRKAYIAPMKDQPVMCFVNVLVRNVFDELFLSQARQQLLLVNIENKAEVLKGGGIIQSGGVKRAEMAKMNIGDYVIESAVPHREGEIIEILKEVKKGIHSID